MKEAFRPIAALFVYRTGAYASMAGVELWDEARDARTYDGPLPVVAHPPCTRWCRLAGLVEARHGHKRGEDGGCFAAALASVRRFGGVLEHPAYSAAWPAFGLPRPPRQGGWVRGFCGGWAAHVEQGRYGHAAKKATWLYAYGTELPALRWGAIGNSAPSLVSWCRNTNPLDTRPRIGKRQASLTPPDFAALLVRLARSVRQEAP